MLSSSARIIDSLKTDRKPIPFLISARNFLGNTQNELTSVTHAAVWKGALYWGLFFFFFTKKGNGEHWAKVGKSQSVKGKKNHPVSSEAGALQDSFSCNYTMFFFPLKDYISAQEYIPSANIWSIWMFLTCVRPWIKQKNRATYILVI